MENHDMLASARRTLIAYIIAVYPEIEARQQALRELDKTLARASLMQQKGSAAQNHAESTCS